MIKELKLKNKVLRTAHKAGKTFGRVWNLTIGLILGKLLNLTATIINRIIVKLPHIWRVKVYNFQRKYHSYKIVKEHKRMSIALAVLLIAVPILVGTLAFIQHRNNQEFATDVPYQEKIAEGAWILHNQESVRQVVNSNPEKPDLNLKEVMNVKDFVKSAESSAVDSDIARPFDTLKYRWMVKISTGTYFEFGGVDASTPDGKVLPVVRVRNNEGAYVAFAPATSIQQLATSSEEAISQKPAAKSYVNPKVEGNVISWEIAEGITAHYTMQEDRVKADYIVKDRKSMSKNQLDFDLEYSEGSKIIKKPDGSLALISEDEEGINRPDLEVEAFLIPVPVIKDNTGNEFEGSYRLSDSTYSSVNLDIVLPENELDQASFPLTVDPIITDTGGNSSTLGFGTGKNLVKDTYGNLIAVFEGGDGHDVIFYKNYDSASFIDTDLDLDFENSGNYAQNFAVDFDSSGDLHIAFHNEYRETINYARLNIIRDSSNRITIINISDYQVLDVSLNQTSAGTVPALTIANKGGGLGKEKVVITWDNDHDTPTSRKEMRVLQKDVWNVGYEDLILSEDNLEGYWRLNERDATEAQSGYGVQDASSNNRDSILIVGTPDYGASPAAILGDSENTAITFDGSTDYISIADNNAFSPVTTTKLTVEAWVRPTGGTDGDYVISKGNSANDWEWSIQRYNSGGSTGFQAHLRNTAGTSIAQANVLGAGYAPDGQWHYIVMTVDTSAEELYLYLNDEYSGSDNTWIGTMSNGADDLRLGYRDGSAYLEGRLDEVAIYSDILTASERTEHFNKAKETFYSSTILNTPGLSGYFRLGTPSGTLAFDESTTANHGTYANVSAYGVNGATGNDWDTAITFSGATDSHVIVPDNDAYDFGTGDYTIEAWIKRSSTPSTDEFIVGHDGDGFSDAWDFYQASGTNELVARIGATNYNSGTENISDGRWHHVVFTADRDGNGTWYKDGKVSITRNISGTSSTNLTNTRNLYIGDRTTAGTEWIGSIDEVAIYKGVALTPDQVREHYQAANDWKNVSEEINSNGSFANCIDSVTRGEAGFATSIVCKGTADAVIQDTNFDAIMHGTVNQIPGKPRRSPDSVKWDDNGSFSDLSSVIDGSSSTTSNISGFTTADYIYVGDSKPFSKVTFDMYATNSATADFALTDVEYCSLSYDGATCDTWTDLINFYDNTDNGTSAFSEDGSLLFDEKENWVTATVNSTTGKYWIRFRPDAAMSADVKIAEVTVNARNSNALMMIGGATATEGLQPAIAVWDDITDEGWENRPDSAGFPWWEGDVDVGFWGFAQDRYTTFYTYCTTRNLSSTVDYVNNRYYVAIPYDGYAISGNTCNGNFYQYIFTIGDDKDPIDRDNWIDTGFPLEGMDNKGFTQPAQSLSTDGSNLYMFINPDRHNSTQSAYLARCSPHAGSDPTICDSGADWDYYINIVDNVDPARDVDLIVSKVTSDISALDMLWNDELAIGGYQIRYDRIYTNSNDRRKIGAASGDDGFHRDCDSGTDDQDIGSIVVKLGRENDDAGCNPGTVESENHAGFRFQNVDVAPGAKISSAYIDFQVASRSGSTALDFNIFGEDADNSSAYSAQTDCTAPCSGNVGERTLTTSSVSQSINFEGSGNVGISYRFDVTDIVQEIICRGVINTQPCVGDFNGSGTWASGNALSILLKSTEGGTSDNWINIFSYDNTQGTLEPTLQINCGDSCSEPKPQEAEWCELGATAGNGSNDCNNNWGSRKKITFDNRASSENLTNFPALVRLDSTKIDYSKVQNAGQDLRFVDATGGAVLRYDIDEWNESGESLVWVRVPQIDAQSNTDYIYLYYNNGNASAGMNEEETYESNIDFVLHLHEDPTTQCNSTYEVCDSTSNNAHGETGGTFVSGDSVNGAIGSAIDFNGTDQGFSGDDSAFPSGNSARTMEGWFRTTDQGPLRDDIIGYGVQTNPNDIAFGHTDGAFNVHVRTTQYSLSSADLVNDGEWHHGVVTYDGTNFKGYVDGVRVGSDQNPGTNPNTTVGTNAWNVGVWSAWWLGSLDEIRVHTGARSADYIEASYLSSKPNSTFTQIGSEETDPTTSEYEELITSDANLAGYWRLGELTGINAVDASTAGNDGTYTNTPTLGVVGAILGDKDTAVTFNGSSQGVDVGSITNLPSGNSSRSMEAWFKTAHSADSFERAIVGYGEQVNKEDIDMYVANGAFCIKVRNAPDNNCFTSTGVVNDGKWHHGVITYDGTNFQAFVDGVKVGSDFDPTNNPNTDTTNGALYVGEWSNFFNGSIDDVAIYSDVLSDAEVLAHYNTGRATLYANSITGTPGLVGYWRLGEGGGTTVNDETTYSADLTKVDTVTFGQAGAIKGDNDTAMTFDGSSGELKLENTGISHLPSGNSARTLEGWFKTTFSADSNGRAIVGWGDAADSDGDNDMYIANGAFCYKVRTTGNCFVNSGLNDGVWHHAVVTYDGTYVRGYIDGELAENPYDLTLNPDTIVTGAADLRIGRWSNYFNGTVDDVAIYSRALTDDEVRERYLAGGGTNRYNLRQFSKGVSIATGSASFSDLDAKFSSADYVAVQGDDEVYVNLGTDLNIHASTSALPTYMMKVNNGRNTNADSISATAVVRSTSPSTNNPIYLQVYRGGTIDNWVTIATDNGSKANTDITLTGATISLNTEDYFINETSGVGTVGAECSDGTNNCWAYFRVYQEGVGQNYSMVLSLDGFNVTFDEIGPSQIAFTNAHRYFATNTCSGTANPFTIEVQNSAGGATPPLTSTTVRVTSNTGGSLTVYSDNTCSTSVTNGDLIFTTEETSKTFYISDTGISNDYILSASVQSGDSLTSDTHFYTIEGGPRLDSRTRIRGGGDTETRIRGGTRIR